MQTSSSTAFRGFVWAGLLALLSAATAAVAWNNPAPASAGFAPQAAFASHGFIDHSVVNRADLLPSAEPSPLSVAAYGN